MTKYLTDSKMPFWQAERIFPYMKARHSLNIYHKVEWLNQISQFVAFIVAAPNVHGWAQLLLELIYVNKA